MDDMDSVRAELCQLSTEGDVCASRALDEYKVPESVLRPLECYPLPNPQYKSAAPMRMYSRLEVLEAALDYHQDCFEAEEERAAKQKAKEERQAQREADGLEAGPR